MKKAVILLLCISLYPVLANFDAWNHSLKNETVNPLNCSWYANSSGEIISNCSDSADQFDNTKNKESEDKFMKLVEDSRIYQTNYCKNLHEYENNSVEMIFCDVKFNGKRFPMYTHPPTDIVSFYIMRFGIWGDRESIGLFEALQFYREKNNIDDPNQIMFLDIGGQIGWFTLNIAYQGYKVVTFEPMYLNEYILRHNLCLNASLDVTFLNYGVFENDTISTIFIAASNTGNGILNYPTVNNTHELHDRGTVKLLKLDHFRKLFKNLAAIKIDIEGSEFSALKGGRSVFLDMQVPFIVTEINIDQLRLFDCDPVEYVKAFVDKGYMVSAEGFRNPSLLSLEDLRSIFDTEKNPGLIMDLFLTHETYYE